MGDFVSVQTQDTKPCASTNSQHASSHMNLLPALALLDVIVILIVITSFLHKHGYLPPVTTPGPSPSIETPSDPSARFQTLEDQATRHSNRIKDLEAELDGDIRAKLAEVQNKHIELLHAAQKMEAAQRPQARLDALSGIFRDLAQEFVHPIKEMPLPPPRQLSPVVQPPQRSDLHTVHYLQKSWPHAPGTTMHSGRHAGPRMPLGGSHGLPPHMRGPKGAWSVHPSRYEGMVDEDNAQDQIDDVEA
ncbi:hypothetical protein LTR66_009713 [Elasticomyces elasticus]|nr:hypothetical protein LTR66_009713 [Elasticomyces elasticus]